MKILFSPQLLIANSGRGPDDFKRQGFRLHDRDFGICVGGPTHRCAAGGVREGMHESE